MMETDVSECGPVKAVVKQTSDSDDISCVQNGDHIKKVENVAGLTNDDDKSLSGGKDTNEKNDDSLDVDSKPTDGDTVDNFDENKELGETEKEMESVVEEKSESKDEIGELKEFEDKGVNDMEVDSEGSKNSEGKELEMRNDCNSIPYTKTNGDDEFEENCVISSDATQTADCESEFGNECSNKNMNTLENAVEDDKFTEVDENKQIDLNEDKEEETDVDDEIKAKMEEETKIAESSSNSVLSSGESEGKKCESSSPSPFPPNVVCDLEKGFDNTSCDLFVFNINGDRNKESNSKLETGDAEINLSITDTEIGASVKSVYTQPVFEDITEDEDSDGEQYENIELELDDLIDAPNTSDNVDNNVKEIQQAFVKTTDAVDNSTTNTVSNKKIDGIMSTGTSISMTNGKTDSNDSNSSKTSENINPSPVEDLKCKPVVNNDNPYKLKKKSTARKSGKPVSQLLESAPLKRINMHPIRNVTMSISEVKGALDFDLDFSKKFKGDRGAGAEGNTYKVISVTHSNSGSKSKNKKKRKKRGYDLPGCKKKKKFKLLDDVSSIGASSVDSISLSESDQMETDSLSSSCSTVPLSDFNNASGSHRDSPIGTSSESTSIASSSPSISVLSSSPLLSVSKTSSSQTKTKGGKKMKSVLEMLHERSKQKAKSGSVENTGLGKTTSTSTTTTTTTIIVSPPSNKTLVDGVKRKGTPRKRRDEVICVSDDDDDEVVGAQRKSLEGLHNSFDTSGSMNSSHDSISSPLVSPSKLSSQPVTQGNAAPVVMMVAQHSNSPGLRSLLPKGMLVPASPMSAVSFIRPENSTNINSTTGNALPVVTGLPVGMKGVTAIPITSLPPGSTIFTAVQGAGSPGNHTNRPFVNIAAVAKAQSHKSLLRMNNPNQTSILPKTSKKPHPSTEQVIANYANNNKHSAQPQQLNNESLRALLVSRKPISLSQCTPASYLSSSISTLTTSSPSFTALTSSFSTSTTATSLINSSPNMLQMLSDKSSAPNSYGSFSKGAASSSSSSQPASRVLSSSTYFPHSSKHVTSLSNPMLKSHIQPPNGISCLTPPKTPDTDSSLEVAVAASLTRPSMGGQGEDSDVLPLCCCKITIPDFNKIVSRVTYCQAIDSIDNKVLGCCNKVTGTQLVRPGIKIPFMAVCEAHRKRLSHHYCCPGCGHFCTQGKFQQCRKEGASSTHYFHKQCMFYRGAKHFCPHCGEETSQCEVEFKLNEDGTSSNLTSRSNKTTDTKERKGSARIGVVSSKKIKTSDKKEDKTIVLPNKKSLNISRLPLGPDQSTLIRLCKCLGEDRPKKYRNLPKELLTPASEGDMEKVFYMLVDGMDPNIKHDQQEDQTALHAAATCGHLGTVFILEQFGAEVHAQDRSLRTPLMCAAENGRVKVVQYLLRAGAKVADRGEDGMTGLHYAAKAGHLEVIRLLLETKNLDVNLQDDGGWTPIIWATESMLPDIVEFLIGQGGDPNKKDNEENTGLHWAAFSGSIKIADMFLELGCELDTPNEHGDRPLHIAARQDHYDIIVHLLAKGANVDVKNYKDETPVESCVNKNGQVHLALKVNQQLRGLANYKLIQPEKLLERDITMGREKNPIACVNKEDTEACPTDYLYVAQNVETSPLNINNVVTGLQSCRCKDDCSSMYCVCARSSVRCWYDKTGKLLEDFNLLEPPLLFECNRACRCWINCNNRVVQNGIMCRMQLFRTNGRGWGVRALMDIPKGTFVCEYVGELISDSEADKREDDSYLFDLDNKDGDTYCIDARKYGNIARFINHLCEPNLVPVKVFVEHQDLRFPRICLFSSREIKAYEELGFDYGEKFWIIKWKQFTCACESAKCKYSKETIHKTLHDYKLRNPDDTAAQENS